MHGYESEKQVKGKRINANLSESTCNICQRELINPLYRKLSVQKGVFFSAL